MNFENYYYSENEKPLDRMPKNGGFAAIFRTIACIGDSLSSGEFQVKQEKGEGFNYYDEYEYSWGQFMARTLGSKVYNFSRGGMSAKWYLDSFAKENNFFSPTLKAQAYIVALGVNDVTAMLNQNLQFGSEKDIVTDPNAPVAETFVGYYTKILALYRAIAPRAKFFLMTCPNDVGATPDRVPLYDKHQALLHTLAEKFENTYVLDFREYAPCYDEKFHENFFLNGHLTATGYCLTAELVLSYIDYIIRKNPEDFKYVGVPDSYFNKD